ncbi:PREDICTED: UBN2_3 domain-containing [Prunus dulcis]|uniref:PREDICTED: UBN2_3 domain-containing n=1 Tax=Prunus dulcis TaxID=3755 RepID=A0A5E4EM91_PRUDU|nr:PREDICTED: UBN2_3 domain-containing [Prunus dulcis]
MSSSAASSSSVLMVSSSNISNFLTIKLDCTNFPLWRAQIVPLLRSRNLLSFVDGSSMCPAAFLIDAEGKLTKSLRSDLMRTTRGDLSIADYLDTALGKIPWAELV